MELFAEKFSGKIPVTSKSSQRKTFDNWKKIWDQSKAKIFDPFSCLEAQNKFVPSFCRNSFEQNKLDIYFCLFCSYWDSLTSSCTAKDIFKESIKFCATLRTHNWEKIEKKKSQHWSGFEPTTSWLWGVRSTTAQQPLPNLSVFNIQVIGH